MARKVGGFERVLDAPALFTVAYDEIGSSIVLRNAPCEVLVVTLPEGTFEET